MYKNHTKSRNRHQDYDLLADLERIKSAITDTAYDIKGKTGEVINQSFVNMKEKSADLTEELGDYAKKKPIKTIGLAMLTGVVIGFLIRRN